MIVQMVSYVVLWLNGLPVGSSISDNLSPRTIITGTTVDFNNHCQLKFGAYAETHERPRPLNSPQSRVQPCICLGSTGNIQG